MATQRGFRIAGALSSVLRLARVLRGRWGVTITAAVLLTVVTVSSTDAQQPRRQRQRVRQLGVRPKPSAKAVRSTVLIEPTAPIANLFARANEGIARGDWKFAVDSLQRIIDDPQHSLLAFQEPGTEDGERSSPPGRFESARRRAIRLLNSLPPEGLRAYRLLNDGRAKRLYDQGRAAGARRLGVRPLRTVVERFLLTRYGDDATDLLASWALDAGRPAEAVTLLTDLVDLVPDRDVPDSVVTAKLAAAYALLGRLAEARALMAGGGGDSTDTENMGDGRFARIADSLDALRSTYSAGALAPTAWPVIGGSSARRGWTPSLDPLLAEDIPWRFDLPGARDAWRYLLHIDPEPGVEDVILPTVRLVSDGQRVFVRTPRGCAALDVGDLSIVWSRNFPGSTKGTPIAVGRGRSNRIPRNHPGSSLRGRRVNVAFEDYISGEISTGHGLVLGITRSGTSPYELGQRDVGRGLMMPWLLKLTGSTSEVTGNRLVAFDTETGEVRWQRGRTGHPDDPLGDVQFRSVPLAVGDRLWVPYMRKSDFYVATLDPTDGALTENILLCTLNEPSTSPAPALKPAAEGGLVFVPSGHGVLFAIDAHSRAIRWASRYGFGAPSRRIRPVDDDRDSKWLPSPPIVSRGLVVLAPVEQEVVMAFAATTGELRWSSPCDGCAYPIGANHERLWLGGRAITCLSLEDGAELWTTALQSSPSGRAVVSADTVKVPTMDGLLSLDSASGEIVAEVELSGKHGPLGNLLCLNNSMYSINASTVRRFPDIERTYPLLEGRHAADPSDVSVATRLAWLDLLSGNPQKAYDVLEAIPSDVLEGEERLALQVAHIRVEALVAMSQRSDAAGRPASEVLSLLERGRDMAQTPRDRLRCSFGIADQLSVMGRHADAYRFLWRLGISPDGDQILSSRQRVDGLARYDVTKRLARLDSELTDTDRDELGRFELAELARLVEELLEHDSSRAGQSGLRAAADLPALGAVGGQSLLELAGFDVGRQKYESAEQYLRNCIRLDTDPAVTLAAYLQLCDLYATGLVDVAVALGRSLDSLLERFSTASFGVTTAVVPRKTSAAGSLSVGARNDELVSDWVARVRSSGAAAFSESDEACLEAVLADEEEPAWSVALARRNETALSTPFETSGDLKRSFDVAAGIGPPRLVLFEGDAGGVLANRAVFHGPGDVLYCQRVSDGALLWHTVLRLPQESADSDQARWSEWNPQSRRAVVEGQTAVFSGRDAFFAVGLVTGRRLWTRPYAMEGMEYTPFNRAMTMAARDGLLAATPQGGRLTLMSMLDGSTVWQRDLRGERVERIMMSEDRVITTNLLEQRVHLFDRADGRLIKSLHFKQPAPETQWINILHVGDMIYGPVSSARVDGVVAIRLSDGTRAWRARLDKPLLQVFRIGDQYLGFGLVGGDLRIVEAATGNLVLERRIPRAHGVVAAALVDGILVALQTTKPGDLRPNELAAFDLAGGEELWRRNDVVTFSRGAAGLRIVGGRIPVAFSFGRDRSNSARVPRITMIDVASGRLVGGLVTLQPGQGPIGVNGDLEIYPATGTMIIGTKNAVHAIRLVHLPRAVDRDAEGL